jgi:gas vesicle protein
MKTSATTTPAAPVLLAVLAGAGAGLLAGVLLAPATGASLRQSLRSMGHKYALLTSEQQQELNHHLAQRATAFGKRYRHLTLNLQAHLQQWGLLRADPRRPY